MFNVNTGVSIVVNKFLTDDDSIFKVVAIPRHKCDKHISTQSEFTMTGGSTISKDSTFFNFLAKFNKRPVVLASMFVETHELAKN